MPDHLLLETNRNKSKNYLPNFLNFSITRQYLKTYYVFIDLGKSDYQFINGFSFCLGTYYDHENLSTADCLPLSRPTFDCLEEVWNELKGMWGDRKKCPERNLDIEIESTIDLNSES